ncbi:unnamed protein product [Owenia fusiformis]|uniref:Uncharacterized protein n=1 Tax=Owenia fusiformis TaxID=6347 RepID=A0A8J1TVT8_OWEFU|nr:unnamed protein product [Owenia fusiformis]
MSKMAMAEQVPNTMKNFGFGLRAMKNHTCLIPLVGIIGFACGMCGTYCLYAMATKPDVRLQKSKKHIPTYEEVEAGEIRKIMEPSPQKYTYDPEILKLRREMGTYKANVYTNE